MRVLVSMVYGFTALIMAMDVWAAFYLHFNPCHKKHGQHSCTVCPVCHNRLHGTICPVCESGGYVVRAG